MAELTVYSSIGVRSTACLMTLRAASMSLIVMLKVFSLRQIRGTMPQACRSG